MKKYLIFAVMLSAALGFWAETEAGQITLQTRVRVTAKGSAAQVMVDLANQGDEAARKVLVSAQGMGVRSEAAPLDRLEPGQKSKFLVRLAPGPDAPGAYPVAVRVDFQDLKGYPFTALAWGIFSSPKLWPPGIRLEAPTIDLAEEGSILATVTPLAHEISWVRVRVVVPPELEARPTERLVELDPSKKTVLEFHLRDRSGRIGSTYPVLFLADYRQKGVRGAAGANGWARVKAQTPFFKRWSLALGLLAGLIFLTVWLLQERKPKF